MPATIDYYFATQSPWAYLGHARFVAMARAAGAHVNVKPADYGQIFAASGGLPLGQRAPQRQAYRLVELKRFSDALGVPLHLQPAFFPVASDLPARLIVAVQQADGADAALALCGRVFAACWAEQRNIAEATTLAALLADSGLAPDRLAAADGAAARERYTANTAEAIAAQVFGAPSYVVDGEIFWGQDRLDLLARRLGVK